MQRIDLSAEARVVRAQARTFLRYTARAAALSAFCGALAACGSVDDLGGPPIDEGTEETGVVQSPLVDSNGLGSNGLGSNGLGSNGLGSNGLGSNGWVTTNTQNWLNTTPNGGDIMKYIVQCAAPSGTKVYGTVNGQQQSWDGNFGLAPSWLNNTPLTTAQQEWISACLLAHVNLAGRQVMVSFRSADATLPSDATERSKYNCREAAFMGNLFTATSSDPLPLVQCGDHGLAGSGRSCDPTQKSYTCPVACYSACDKPTGNVNDPFSSCSVSVNGTSRSYSHIVTTYLPIDSSQGCPGWGYDMIPPRNASFTGTTGGSSSWSWSWNWQMGGDSCSGYCGGYTPYGCSCTPDCAAQGNCCGDYATICGTPPTYVPITAGQSSCPAGYTTHTGNLGASGLVSYWPSASGYKATLNGPQHATLLGPSGSDFDLYVQWQRPSDSAWITDGRSTRASADESLHYFYGKAGITYRWVVKSYAGTGNYTFCMNDVRGSVLKSVNSNKCMSASGGGVTNGTPIVQQSCVTGSYQGWRPQLVGTNQYTFVNVNSGKCLDVPGATSNSGAVIQEWDCNGTNAQKWNSTTNGDGSQTFTSQASGKCLDVFGASVDDGAQLVQWDCNGGANQKFFVQAQ